MTLLMGSGVLVAISHDSSYAKIDNLNNQREIILTLTNLPKDDAELALIQFNGKSNQLHFEIEKLRNMYKYNFIERLLLSNSQAYLADLDKLSSLTTLFNEKAHNYYTKDLKDEHIKEEELKNSFYSLNKQIDTIIFHSITYSKAKFNIHKNITYISFIIVLFTTIWYRKRLNAIYNDIKFLYNVDAKFHTIAFEEIDAISLRMKRKPVTSDNPTMLDPVTGINNIKGMMNSYSEKKGMKESNYTSVTVIEIDNFSKSNRPYSQEFTQGILKKVAFTISLHEQATDVMARTDYNQFTIILSRPNKEQSFKEIDIIRKNISELKLASPETGLIVVTVSGGFVVKTNNTSLEESIRNAKKILEFSQKHGTNKISQIKDISEKEL
jgi:diguanylate cyclase (GGDEF)-like protein